MNAILTFDQLKNYTLYACKQFWYYVILINPLDLSPAGQAIFDNLNIFHFDSGEDCQYFIPGFINTGTGLFKNILAHFSSRQIVDIPRFGKLQFDDEDFVAFYKELENRNPVGWRYSGECELLLFNLSMENKIKLNNFVSYNLDDIIRNGRNVSEFVRMTINVGKDATDQVTAKQMLDEKYYEMIMPNTVDSNLDVYNKAWDMLRDKGFSDNSYLFISYSSNDYRMVSKIRSNLMKAGISCWMAPYDIPTGSNYALVIEHAIKHAQKFVLMLSQSAVSSVWVGKELKRAVSRFQFESPEKICVVWLNGEFPLKDTPLALPLEDIQVNISMKNNPNNYYLLVSKEKQTEILKKHKANEYLTEIHQFLSSDRIISDLSNAVSRIFAVRKINADTHKSEDTISDLCTQLNEEIKSMEKCATTYNQEFISHYCNAMKIIAEILPQLLN